MFLLKKQSSRNLSQLSFLRSETIVLKNVNSLGPYFGLYVAKKSLEFWEEEKKSEPWTKFYLS